MTYPNGAVELTYDTAGAPTYGNLAIGEADLQRLAGQDGPANTGDQQAQR